MNGMHPVPRQRGLALWPMGDRKAERRKELDIERHRLSLEADLEKLAMNQLALGEAYELVLAMTTRSIERSMQDAAGSPVAEEIVHRLGPALLQMSEAELVRFAVLLRSR